MDATRDQHNKAYMTTDQQLTGDSIDLILTALRTVAARCDGAVEEDGQGFNGTDTRYGRHLASLDTLNERDALIGLKIVLKYKRQIGDDTHAALSKLCPEDVQKDSTKRTEAVCSTWNNDPATLLPWSEPKKVNTSKGPSTVRSAEPDERFWTIYRAQKDALKAMGVSISKYNGYWQASWWINTTPKPTAPTTPTEPAITLPAEPITLDEAIKSKLLWYQTAHVEAIIRAIQTHGAALDASDTGAGKTFVALAVMKALGLRVTVICPKAVIPSWRKAAAHFGGIMLTAINHEMVKTGKTPHGKWVGNGKDEHFEWNLDPQRDGLIFDEVHRCKARDSQNAELLLAAKDSGAKTLCLSATAATNPLEMKALAYTLGLYPNKGSYWGWATRNGVWKGKWGMEFTGGLAAIGKIHEQIFPAGRGARIRISEVPGFPATTITPEILDFNGASKEIAHAYEVMKQSIANLEARSAQDRQAIILTEILRARQKAEILKVPSLVTMAQDAIEEGNSVALFVNFNETVDSLAAMLKTDCVVRGGQSAEDRQHNIDRFQAGQSFARLALICPTYSAQDLKQALGRVHRAKSNETAPNAPVSRVIICNIRAGGVGISLHNYDGRPSIQRIVFAEGTIEEQAARAVEGKLHNIEMLNDGDILCGLNISSRQEQLVA